MLALEAGAATTYTAFVTNRPSSGVHGGTFVVPNPSPTVCAEIRAIAPHAIVFQTTSHALLAALAS